MPEENWISHGGVPACDLCHARKVKCDRQEPCSNCVATKAECLRNRHKRAPRPKVRTDEKIQALVQRLSSLENSVLTTQRTPSVVAEERIAHVPTTIVGNTSPERPAKRQRTVSSLDGLAPASTPEVDTTQQSTHEARHLISNELSTNGLLSNHQRSVLETAISFVDHLSHAPVPAITDRSTFDKSMYIPTDLTQGEILNVILGTETKAHDNLSVHFHTLDHIPPKAVERIALSLMDSTADEKTLNLYKVIIHFKAAVVLYASTLQGPKSPAVQKHIRQLEYDHLTAALTALDSVSFLTAPSLLLVQVLITGAMMMQIMGNPASCWELSSHASRTIVALGYHTVRLDDPANEFTEDIHAVVAWCSQFDSVMSLLLLRPRSLPPLHVNPSALLKEHFDLTNPMSIFEIMTMEMVPVHNKLLDLTLEATQKRPMATLKDDVIWLRIEMIRIQELMTEERPTKLIEARLDILLHWRCLEFKYFSTLTSVHRLSPSCTTNPCEREECLQSARKALECVISIQELGKKLGHFIEGYDPYLAWTILSYPLCPFFVVFCNVVGTSNARDFQLLQDVTNGISTLVTENKYVNRLHKLCATLLGLCRPLVQVNSFDGQAPPVSTGFTAHTGAEPQGMTFDSTSHIMNTNGDVGEALPSSWNDDMMWQLFQSQPSLDWFNADILDPTWDLGTTK
ncbi:putative Zn(II)2Cys6 transcription factor-like protein [Plenodomus tracheiphilus IPT5]|uniref:Zn(II)2Cys6 transcription factor-like protein n=1 Tax=Plenodomus tracheiphilus IPT5 TaxID=1408161 RepID=A0A6A7BFA0_9PLEO|nr:putative Zn(II)2Cys6 transcription factor-like protein [Plenodomus tracheiphilus IPT5]